jgi:excisionase family DNA binding protein
MPKGYPKALEEHNMSELLTVRDLAEDVFDVHPNTIYRWVKDHGIPHLRIGNRIYFRKEAIQEWMLANEDGTLTTLVHVHPEEATGG